MLDWVTTICARGSEVPLEEGWHRIKGFGIDKLCDILRGVASESKPFGHKGYSSLYTLSFRMCSQPGAMDWSQQIYERYIQEITAYLNEHVIPSLQQKHDLYLLNDFVHHWDNHKLMVKWMGRLFMHLDKAYVVNSNVASLTSAGLRLYYNIVYDGLRKNLAGTILSLINQDREGASIDHASVRTCVQVLEMMGVAQVDNRLKSMAAALKRHTDLEVYTKDFEVDLLKHTREFYARKAQTWMAEMSTPDHLRAAEAALEAESHRVERYLNMSSLDRILGAVESELVQRPAKTLLEREGSGCMALLVDERREELGLMYTLFGRLGSERQEIGEMSKIFQQRVLQLGAEAISAREALLQRLKEEKKKETASDPTFVKTLLDIHAKMMSMVELQFGKDKLFYSALRNSFIDIVNRTVGAFPIVDSICSFCDHLLRGAEKLSGEVLDEQLECMMQLFGYVTDKDMFAEQYRQQLSKRLLAKRSVSDDAERTFIGKMKMQCGSAFTSKMEGMMSDFALCDDLRRRFMTECGDEAQALTVADNYGAVMEFMPQVLTSSNWPSFTMVEATLPPLLQAATDKYVAWYANAFANRSLKWAHSIGEATVRGTFGSKWYDMQLATMQVLPLLFFNTQPPEEEVSFQQLMDAMGTTEEVTKRTLHSLSCGKYKLLTKTPMSRGIDPVADRFKINLRFSDKLRKFRVPMASLDESAARTNKRVEEDRSFAIDAALVRVMKARKQLEHVALTQEVMAQLHFFRPDPKLIKKRIEQLIEREYLERDPNNTKLYKYLA